MAAKRDCNIDESAKRSVELGKLGDKIRHFAVDYLDIRHPDGLSIWPKQAEL